LNINLITEYDDFVALGAEWNETLGKSKSSNPFSTFEWLKSWLDIFKDEIELFVVIASENSTLVGMAPLALNKKRQIIFMGFPLNDYADIIVADGHEKAFEEILDFLFAQKRRWHRIILDQLRQDMSGADQIVACLSRNGRQFRTLLSDSCPAMVLDDLEAARKIYYKRNITTYVNWFKSQGDFRYNVYTETEEACRRLDDLFIQHRERRGRTPFPSQFERENIRRFFKEFMRAMHPKHWVQFSSLTLNGRFLALYLSFEYEKILYLYTTSFDAEYSKRSPGQVILRHLFDYAVEHGIKRMDFARGGESYKDRFSNTIKRNRKIIIYRSAFARLAADIFHSFRYSKLVDILYRNQMTQSARLAFIYHHRKSGLFRATGAAVYAFFNPGKKD